MQFDDTVEKLSITAMNSTLHVKPRYLGER